jgi:hypothetical protein
VIPYDQPLRKRGITKNNFFTLFDMAMLGITSSSKAPLRLATLCGFTLSALSLLVAVLFLILKLTFWHTLPAGYAPVVIGVFFLGSIQIFLIGVLGEYIGAVLQQVRHRPIVVERARAQAAAAGSRCACPCAPPKAWRHDRIASSSLHRASPCGAS